MEGVRNLKWFEFNQNNSGGSFIVNDKVCHRLFIEAKSFDDAVEKAEELGCYWDGVINGVDCPCCGDRWSCWDDEPIDLKNNSIEEYAQVLADKYGLTTPDIRIYYDDGKVKEIFSNRFKK